MKKIKLLTLSLLALTSASALASCGGQKAPVQKPDVYFRAKSVVIENGATKLVDYKNEECAKVTYDKENLKYGEQDVVITVEPKDFFTFREYDTTSWARIGSPVRPYVGLGSPVSLYSYPLQENVAWTFKDLSTETETPGFWIEKYEITVKKEFFKKNIVIDYGNVFNNSIYALNSEHYSELFTKVSSLTGDFSNSYEVSDKESSFAVANRGAIVTYTFKNKQNPFTFTGWDKKPQAPDVPTNKALEYDHYQILGYPKEGAPTNLATFEEGVEAADQKFRPKVSEDGQYITFFIDWTLLADGAPEYAPKYDHIEVRLKEPTVLYKEPQFNFAGGIKRFAGDFFQYADKDTPKSLTDNNVFETYEIGNENNKYKFTNILDVQNLAQGKAVQFATAFQLPEDDPDIPRTKDLFHISINGVNRFTIDLQTEDCTPEMKMTNWHGTEGGEKEVPYWVSSNGWHLIQLNPEGDPARSAGFFTSTGESAAETFSGKGNLYFLYTDNINNVSDYECIDITIDFDPLPVFTEFTLSEDSQKYGTFNGQTSITLKSSVDEINIPFTPADGYAFTYFNVGLEPGEVGEEIPFYAEYQPNASGTKANIKLRRNKSAQVTSVTVKLYEQSTCAILKGQTQDLGEFANEQGVEQGPICYPVIEEKQKSLNLYFKFSEFYASEIFEETEAGGLELSKELCYEFTYNGTELEGVKPTIASSPRTIQLALNVESGISQTGGLFEISFKFIGIHLNNMTAYDFFVVDHQPLGNHVGSNDSIFLNLECKSEIKDSLRIDVGYTKNPATAEIATIEVPTKLNVTINFNFDEFSTIQNGEILTLTVVYA